ncbi:MAG: hypothetical protein KDJ44_22245 [Rhodoblastus sp.]|nr:hypothetical protein [Rhodoblastus sp.]
MKLAQIADEASLFFSERRDTVRNLEEAIRTGRSKRPLTDLESRRGRVPAAKKIARALVLIAKRRADLPADLVAEIERDEA